MNISDEIINLLSSYPLELDSKEYKEIGLYVLPFSIGIEIECDKGEYYNEKDFKDIPNILAVQTDSQEQRYRIPNGINGLKCLYSICTLLHGQSIFNVGSGIHYHVDFTDSYHLINDAFIEKHQDYVLKELDTWNYIGTFNSRKIGEGFNWVRLQPNFKTLEFRIGEMTFDYKLMYKRITHLVEICKNLKINLYKETVPDYNRVYNTIKNRKVNLYELEEFKI